MIISTGKSRRDLRWRAVEMDWPQLVSKLGSFLRTPETVREYKAMTKEQQGLAKDIGGFVGGKIEGGRRKNEAVVNRCLITLDADNAYPGMWEDVTALYDFTMCCYSTHSHTPDKPRLRFVIPLQYPVTPEQYVPISRKVAEWLGIDTMDPSTYEPARLMYWPSCPRDGEPEFHQLDGELLDPQVVLHEYGLGEAWKDSTLWPIGKQEQEIRVRQIKHAGDPEEKPGIVGLFCRTYDVPAAIEEFLSEVYSDCGNGRYTYTPGSTAAGAVLYDSDQFLFSNHGTDPAGGQLCNSFDLVRIHLFRDLDCGNENQEINRRPSYKKMCEFAADLPAVKEQMAREQMASLSDICAAGQEDKEGGRDPDDLSWTQALEVNHKTGIPDNTIGNAQLIMRNDPAIADSFCTNLLTGRPVVRKPVPWRKGAPVKDKLNGDQWLDADHAGLRLYMEQAWKFRGKAEIKDAFDLLCTQNSFHPVREYLMSLEWDGLPRVDELLIKYMGATDTEYVRTVTRKWMAAAVKRAMMPGCKFDNMLVLVGPQGIGKSNLAIALSKGWFTDSLGRMDASKESYERLSGVWIAEVAELAATKRAEVEDIKNFITKREDTYRKAYRMETETYPRQCVFYGTTNDPEFLRDRTGSRRFWPVEVKGFDRGQLKGLEAEVDQIWAESVVNWRRGEVLWLDDEKVDAEAKAMQAAHSVQDELAGQIESYLDVLLPTDWSKRTVDERRGWFSGSLGLGRDDGLELCNFRRDVVCASEIRVELCDEPLTKGGGNDMLSRRISNIMNNMPGWERSTKATKLGPYGCQRAVWLRKNAPTI